MKGLILFLASMVIFGCVTLDKTLVGRCWVGDMMLVKVEGTNESKNYYMVKFFHVITGEQGSGAMKRDVLESGVKRATEIKCPANF